MTGVEIALVISNIITPVGAWVAGRKKNRIESSLLEIKGVTAIKEFYESALNDTNKQLARYILISEANQKEIQELKTLVKVLMDNSCTVQNCSLRKTFKLPYIKRTKIYENHGDTKDNKKEVTE